MNRLKQITALLLLFSLVLSLCACQTDEPNSSAASTAPTSPTETQAPPTAAQLYTAACEALTASNLVLRYDYNRSRTVGDCIYTESSTTTASYIQYGTDELEAMVDHTLRFGTYETRVIDSYISGCAYTRANNCSFACDMTAEEFLAQQIPLQLITTGLYGSVSMTQDETQTVITCTDPLGAESWLGLDENAVLTTATGQAYLAADGSLVQTTYHAEYLLGTTQYTLDLTLTAESPQTLDLSAEQPVYSDTCVKISDLNIPKMMMRVVGDVYTANAVTCSYNDTLYSQAFGVIRTQSCAYDLWDSGEDFLCLMDTQVSIQDYTGNISSNSQTISFIDGVYSSVTNDGDPSVISDVTAEQARINCEDAILASLLELSHIGGVTVTDTGDFLYLEFDGNDSYAESLCDSIYALFAMDLDSYADSYTTAEASFYLCINKYTCLPVSLGTYLERTHIIDGVSYQMTYQLDQAIQIPGLDAYYNITGSYPADTTEAETVSPLFYRVTGADGQSMYLLGTIHVGDSRTGALPQEILDAFAASDALAVEVDVNAFEAECETDLTLQASLTEAYYYTDWSTYQDYLDKTSAAELQQLIYISGGNFSSAPYLRLSFWSSQIESFYIAQSTGLSSGCGMDSRLLVMAAAQEKPVYQVESGLKQIQMYADFSDKLQELLITELLATDMLSYGADVQTLYDLWCSGDLENLNNLLFPEDAEQTDLTEEYQKAMYTSRNKSMLKKAKKYLESGETVFCAVGLAHLLGEDGLVQTLQDAGYTVELVTYE